MAEVAMTGRPSLDFTDEDIVLQLDQRGGSMRFWAWPAPGAKLYITSNSPGTDGTVDIWELTWHPEGNGNGLDDLDEGISPERYE